MSRKRQRKSSNRRRRHQDEPGVWVIELPHLCRSEHTPSRAVKEPSAGVRTRGRPRGRRFKSCSRYKESPGQPQVDLDFFFGGIMRSHRLPITLTGVQRRPAARLRRWFRSPRARSALLEHLLGMSTTKLGLEPLIGVEELAE